MDGLGLGGIALPQVYEHQVQIHASVTFVPRVSSSRMVLANDIAHAWPLRYLPDSVPGTEQGFGLLALYKTTLGWFAV